MRLRFVKFVNQNKRIRTLRGRAPPAPPGSANRFHQLRLLSHIERESITKKVCILSGTYFTILAVLSPYYDVMKLPNDVMAHWLVVNAVLNEEKMINGKTGEEWLPYKSPQVCSHIIV